MKAVLQVLLLSLIGLLLVKNIKLYIVSTASMEPLIKIDSFVVSINISNKTTFRQKDIIVYKIPQFTKPVTHRIIRIIKLHDKTFFITKGDANSFEDPYPISRDEIIGKIIFVIPYLGKLLNSISSYKLLSLTFYSPIGFLFGKSIRNLFRFIK
jgi:signal peptidase